MMNRDILNNVLLAINDSKHHLYELHDTSRCMDDIYSECIPFELAEFSSFNFCNDTLIAIFGQEGLAAIDEARKKAIKDSHHDRTKLLFV